MYSWLSLFDLYPFSYKVPKKKRLVSNGLIWKAVWNSQTDPLAGTNRAIGLMVKEFANGPGDLVSIFGQVIQKTQKMILDATLLNTQNYKVPINGKVEQSRE